MFSGVGQPPSNAPRKLSNETIRHFAGGCRRDCLQGRRLAILFRCTAETLATIVVDSKHLGVQLGVTSVVPKWGQTFDTTRMSTAPRPGGGASLDGTLRVAIKTRYRGAY